MSETNERLRNLYDKCETNYRGLNCLGVNETSYSTSVVPGILDKLPESFRFTITRGIDFGEWSMKELLEAISKEIELREAHESTSSTRSNERQEKRDRKTTCGAGAGGSAAALHKRQGQSKMQRKCAVCLQDHPDKKCEKVTNIGERKRLARKFGRCFN